jgi:putative ABC transport system permease protein
VPARRATHVDPVEAMRDAVTPGTKPVSRKRLVVSAAIIAVGLAALLGGLFGGASGSAAAALVGLGLVVMIFGVAVLAPVLVRPLARAIGTPLQRVQGLPGRLARENAERQPQRTAITASALMIGLALVVFTAIFAAGLRGSIDKVIDEQLSRSALIVTHDDGFSPVPPGVAEQLAKTEGVTVVSPLRWDQANVEGVGDSIPATGVDPATVTQLFEPEIADGGLDALAALRDDQAFASEDWAESNNLAVGDTFEVETPTGARVGYELVGTYDNQVGMLGEFLVTNGAMTKDWNQPDDAFILAGGQGSPETLARAAEQSLEGFPVAKAQTLAEYKDESADQVNQLLGLVYALLSLSVIVALLGIVNTLALAVHERTRELGLLRAVGMSKRQVRRMVRAESVITALIGAALGLVLGIVFAVVVSRPLADEGFVLTFPIGTLIILSVLAALAGVLAAIPPARRASRVDVLRAVTTE